VVDEAKALVTVDNALPDKKLLRILIGFVILVSLPVLTLAFRPAASTSAVVAPGSGFSDDFNRVDLGLNYFSTGAYWRIVNGELLSPGAKNNPLWLRAALPENVQVDFDARSESPDGDVKCEIFGDGYSHASGYILIFGGWSNNITAIARLDEHGVAVTGNFPSPLPNDGRVRVERRDLKVVQGQMYHWTIRRQGEHLSWLLDGQPILEIIDHEPLRGSGHDRFAFNTWDVDAFYDNLKITPL
jgi:hypothetical protein